MIHLNLIGVHEIGSWVVLRKIRGFIDDNLVLVDVKAHLGLGDGSKALYGLDF